MEEEPSVLDFITAYIRWAIQPRRFPRPSLPPDTPEPSGKKTITGAENLDEGQDDSRKSPFTEEGVIGLPTLEAASLEEILEPEPQVKPYLSPEDENRGRQINGGAFPWKSILALVLAIAAQMMLEPPDRSLATAILLYSVSGFLVVWAVFQKEWVLIPVREEEKRPMDVAVQPQFFWVTLILAAGLFLVFGGNRFNPINLALWAFTIYFVVRSLRIKSGDGLFSTFGRSIRQFIQHPSINLRISGWQIILVLAAILAVFFRFYRLGGVPGEMFSDHAEKLLDVGDVLNGKYPIFFPRNTGREALQMYLTAAIALIFKTGLSFISLKLGTALAGALTLPYIYKLGKEVGNKWVGLLALILAGMAYWPNVISRIGLRFPLYPLFTAPVLFYLVRGIRTSNRNDIILAGIALGLGLHGYSPMRIVPFVILILVGLYLLHPQSRGKRASIAAGIAVLGLVSFIIFLPLFRYMADDPQMFGLRAFSRLGTTERSFPGPVWLIFLTNLWKAGVMFFWDNGNIWVHSVVGRPALDVITAALFFSGLLLILIRYLRQRNWIDLWLLVSIPLLMLPSILSLAFPDENPSLNRTGAAIIPVFIIAAIALESLLAAIITRVRQGGKALAAFLGISLLSISALQNYNLVFDQFNQQFINGAWNTSEIGHIIQAFSESIGSPDTAYVVPYPYWVDTRLVGINAGFPARDYALWPEDFSKTIEDHRAKLFILKPEDSESLAALKTLYPSGVSWVFAGQRQGKDFVEFFVPMQTSAGERNIEP